MLHPNLVPIFRSALLWFIFYIGLWLFFLQPLLIPAVSEISNFLFGKTFPHIYPRLFMLDWNSWVAATRIVAETSSTGTLQTLNFRIGQISFVLFSYPVYWAAATSIPYKKIKNMILGTSLLFLITIFYLWMKVLLPVYLQLSSGIQYFVYDLELTQVPYNSYSSLFSNATVNFIFDLATYFIVFILPILLIYNLSRPYWQNQLDD